jgi:glutamate dehydrogenase/leucine dehydrogenase
VTSENVPALKCRAICGGANNQLAARSLEEERSLARTLMERSILYVPDWLASAGGAIHGVMEYEARDAFDPRHARARIGRLCGWAVDEILEQSKKTGLPALEIAIERFLGPLLG